MSRITLRLSELLEAAQKIFINVFFNTIMYISNICYSAQSTVVVQ